MALGLPVTLAILLPKKWFLDHFVARGAALIGDYKLIYYKGTKEIAGKNRFELYDLSSDPEELTDINSSSSATANALRGELLEKIGPYITA